MSPSRSDRCLGWSLGLAAFVSGSLGIVICGYLMVEAADAFGSGKFRALFTDLKWQPGSVRDPQFGMLPMLLASFLITILSGLIAVPAGIGAAIFQVFYAPPALARWLDRFLELLAGVPSVIFGFWGLAVIVPLINHIHPPGQSLLAAGVVLALMILPTITLTSRSALRSVDPEVLRGAEALGLSRPCQILGIALPAARRGISSGCILGVTRAIGETMAVVMVCGNIAQIPHSWFDPVRPITATIALEMGYATEGHQALLFAIGLVLVVVTGFLVMLASRKEEG